MDAKSTECPIKFLLQQKSIVFINCSERFFKGHTIAAFNNSHKQKHYYCVASPSNMHADRCM